MLLSASSDSLVAISDARQSDEDESVLGVVNTGASVARAGWGGSRRKFPKAIDLDDGQSTSSNCFTNTSLGAFYSISDMQTIGMWEADGFTDLLPVRDVRQTYIPANGTFKAWETEFVIDATTNQSLLQNSESVAVFCGEQSGSVALLEIPNALSGDHTPWSLHFHAVGGHTEVVRSVSWDVRKNILFTGGEDGHLCAWALSEQTTAINGTEVDETIVSSQDGNLALRSTSQTAATGPTRNNASLSRGSPSSLFSRSAKDGQRHAAKPY